MFDQIPTTRPATPLLDMINSPADLRELPPERLPELARELRHFLLFTVGQTGGHFGAGLGVVELTIALHYIFNTPEDKLVWDVGHQTYPHKILTGRREQMATLRQQDGIAPFPSRAESVYDTFGVGHSSTSISAALGFAVTAAARGDQARAVAIIGDGAMTAGLAYEALCHAADLSADVIIVLNDNAMSISQPVGSLSRYFASVLRLKNESESPVTLFEQLGLRYQGPVDGHDITAVCNALAQMKDQPGPALLHVITRKGKGYGPAEASPVTSHAMTKIEPMGTNSKPGRPYAGVFGEWACDMAAADERLVAITPAMREGSDLVRFSETFPQRYFDVAIAEQHAVAFAAGLAASGAKPVVAIYSTFLQRAYDQVIHDVAIQELDVLFAIDRAGLLEDGPTHSGVFDLSFLRCVPNMIIMAPSNENEARLMLTTGYQYPGPAAVRYPRGNGPGAEIDPSFLTLPIGKGVVRRAGERVALLAFGSMNTPASIVADRMGATLVDMRFVKPLDDNLVFSLLETHELLVTVEENVVAGGAGAAVAELLAGRSRPVNLLLLGIGDEFVPHDKPAEMLARCGLDAAGIERAIQRRLDAGD
ncbi:MAG: 1-deoxy-D-xylulose-5-phosphate synthase [Pseudomonadota bacterium]